MSAANSAFNAKPLADKYGMLTPISREGRKATCRCDCGSIVTHYISNLTTGQVVHCGCSPRRGTHHMSRTTEYRVWMKMRDRCVNPKSDNYPSYGGRGIEVCSRWAESFENFYADMGQRPSPQHTLDRRDNDGPYSPENCRWATKAEQMCNRRVNVRITAFGETKVLSEWARDPRCAVGYKGLQKRLRNGMAPEDAISTPPANTAQNLGVYLTKGPTNPFAVRGRPKKSAHADRLVEQGNAKRFKEAA